MEKNGGMRKQVGQLVERKIKKESNIKYKLRLLNTVSLYSLFQKNKTYKTKPQLKTQIKKTVNVRLHISPAFSEPG